MKSDSVLKKWKEYWNKLSLLQKSLIATFVLAIFIPIAIINGGLSLSNWIFQYTGWNFSASGLANPDWFAFLGSFFGGVATVLAVWWTVSQTNMHYEQTSNEQKRQSDYLDQERERQRKLDVLPLILLQPRVTLQSGGLALLIGEVENSEDQKAKLTPCDELKPIYEEFDVSEVTIVFSPDPNIRIGGITDEELKRVKNNIFGINKRLEKEDAGHRVTTFVLIPAPTITFIRPFLFVNAGKEAAINILISIATLENQTVTYLHHVFSLMSKEKIKLNFLVDIHTENKESVTRSYKLIIAYNDIYANRYYQEFPIEFHISDEKPEWNMGLDISQISHPLYS